MSARNNVLVLGSEQWRIGVLPEVGASLAFGQIADDDGWVDLLRPTPTAARAQSMDCSSYVLAPWSNRVRDGLLRFEGRTWQLRKNEAQVNALHGTAMEFSWRVDAYDSTTCELVFDSATVVGANFPWTFKATVRYAVAGPTFEVTTTLLNTADEPFPAGFGHHPYFQRTLAGASDEVRVQIPAAAAFKLHNCLPDGPPVALEPRLDFREMRPLGSELIDDNLTARDADAPIRLLYPRSRRELHITADPVFSSLVLYVPQGGAGFFAVEPVTNANDGFSLYERGVPGSGVFVLEPGEERTGVFQVRIVAYGRGRLAVGVC
jgi:aldose 1-epimerase